MKKFITILIFFLISTVAKAQIIKMQVQGQKGVTTAQRDVLTVPSNEYWSLYNSTTSQWEYWDGDSWEGYTTTVQVFEKELVDSENNINVGFDISSNAIIFYNGKKIPNNKWSGEGTQVLNLSLDTKLYDKLTI